MAPTLIAPWPTGNRGIDSRGVSHVDAILDAVRHHLGMEIAFASRYDGDSREFTHIRADIPVPAAPGDREPLDQTFCWHVLHKRLPELIRNAMDLPLAVSLPITNALPVGRHISVPLRLRDGSVYGSFCCLSRTADYSLTERDLYTVRAFAELAATQIGLEEDQRARHDKLGEQVRAIISAGQPAIHLQPIHRLDGGSTVGAEALARFPDAADRSPAEWFDEAAQAGLGVELELAAVRQGLAALPHIPPGQYLSLNVSPSTVMSGLLEPLLADLGGRDVVLELTEHSRVEDYGGLRKRLDRLRPHVRIAIDDVGAGYAGLQHILAIAPDILKLDISLSRDVDRDPAKRALTLAMVSFASQIGSLIVAEGVEREGERKALLALGVDHGQGWLFSKAMPVVAAQQYLLGVGNSPEPRAAPSSADQARVA